MTFGNDASVDIGLTDFFVTSELQRAVTFLWYRDQNTNTSEQEDHGNTYDEGGEFKLTCCNQLLKSHVVYLIDNCAVCMYF